MLEFKSNFFFIKFSVFFFIATIFGYWSIDLNAEELYIAFSFFFLFILSFTLVRKSVLFFFVNSVNAEFNRVAGDLLTWMCAILYRRATIQVALVNSANFYTVVQQLVGFFKRFTLKVVPHFYIYFRTSTVFLRIALAAAIEVFKSSSVHKYSSHLLIGDVKKLFNLAL
jgi:hypothetical protein